MSVMVPISFFLAAFILVLFVMIRALVVVLPLQKTTKFEADFGAWGYIVYALVLAGIITSFFV